MKKLLMSLMLFISILQQPFAQSKTPEDKAFEIPPDIILNRRFYIDLGKGNKLTIELTDISDLKTIQNIDSLLRVFVADITPFRDSLSDPLTSKRIDYVIDAFGRKKVRIQQFQPKGDSYLLNQGEISSLKISQDTINIIGIIPNPPKPVQKISTTRPRYYHLVFYLNNIGELAGYMNGVLEEKLVTIQKSINTKWPLILGSGSHYLRVDKSISADRPKGFTPGETGDFLEGTLSVNLQNYKNYFVPSFSVGAKLVLTNRDRSYKWEPGISWEPNFLFARDSSGKLQTYRNDFLTLTYGQGGTTDHDSRKDFSYSTVFSLGYLIRRRGNFYDKNTFRLGAGEVKLLKTAIEPIVYFNNFFKDVTPGIRITQTF